MGMRRLVIDPKRGMRMSRLGALKFGKQEKWDRAPKRRGMWAFPYPYFEMFFAVHQYSYLAPKKYRYDERLNVVNGGFFLYDDEKYEDFAVEYKDVRYVPEEFAHYGPLGKVVHHTPEGFWDEREKWISTVGVKLLPIRHFYWDGEVYTHFSRNGEVLGLDEWERMDVRSLARLIIKNRGDMDLTEDYCASPLRITNASQISRYSHDHFEVFFTRDMGKLSG